MYRKTKHVKELDFISGTTFDELTVLKYLCAEFSAGLISVSEKNTLTGRDLISFYIFLSGQPF